MRPLNDILERELLIAAESCRKTMVALSLAAAELRDRRLYARMHTNRGDAPAADQKLTGPEALSPLEDS